MLTQPKLKLVKYDPGKHSPKDGIEKLNDFFFILFILLKGEEKDIPITIGILIKTLFTAQVDLSKKISFLHTGFYPYSHGPFNKKFYSYISELEEMGLVKKDGYNLSLTTNGVNSFQPILEEIKRESEDYNLIENEIDKKIVECKSFWPKSRELHKEQLINEIDEGKVITMQEAIDNPSKYWNAYVESAERPDKEFILPNSVINRLLDISAGIKPEDYAERIILNDHKQLLEMLK